ncbi:unnamed protein product [Lactuca virosa]|uniref:Uncharacterized protein n=1 Tax=Lactuca virosa TaxID=75947 RepID=A0AAU9MJU7_9ASTR|nr:unnamed protein product [Lactuca virosa]
MFPSSFFGELGATGNGSGDLVSWERSEVLEFRALMRFQWLLPVDLIGRDEGRFREWGCRRWSTVVIRFYPLEQETPGGGAAVVSLATGDSRVSTTDEVGPEPLSSIETGRGTMVTRGCEPGGARSLSFASFCFLEFCGVDCTRIPLFFIFCRL